MDPYKRIEELEHQVDALSDEVRRLRQDSVDDDTRHGAVDGPPFEEDRQQVREARVWEMWLSRMAVVLIMTAIVLVAGKAANTEGVEPWQKIGLGCALAGVGIALGLATITRGGLLAHAALGAGLAALYFTAYAAFFVPNAQVSTPGVQARLLLFSCLLVMMVISYWRRSQIAAVMGLFIVSYTIVTGCLTNPGQETLYYSLGAGAMLAGAALAFHASYRWRFFTWLTLIATYAAHIYFFRNQPAGLAMGEKAYFLLSRGTLTCCYACLSLACISDARKTSGYKPMVVPLAFLNSLMYFPLVWGGVSTFYPDKVWIFRLTLAIALGLFALMAETRGPRRNYLLQLFIAKTVIMSTLTLAAVFDGPMLWVALAFECLALAVIYEQSGIVVLKVSNLAILAIAFVGCVISVKAPGMVRFDARLIHLNWFCCGGTAVILALVAVYHELLGRRLTPDERSLSGHWFLADTFLDAPAATVSLLHAAASALLLLTITIIDQGDQAALPYYLAAESMVMAIAGFILVTPQLEVGSVLLLVASHVSFYFFMLVEKQGFEQRGNFAYATVLLAGYTYLAAFLWERYLKRVKDGRIWEHNFIAPIPYLGATYMATTFVTGMWGHAWAPMAYNAIGVIMLSLCLLIPFPGMKVSGLVCLAAGAGTFSYILYDPASPLLQNPRFLPLLAAFLATFVVGERLLRAMRRHRDTFSRADEALRTILVAAGGAMGIVALNKWCDDSYLTLYWLALGMAGVAMGIVFKESRYLWASILILGMASLRVFTHAHTGRPWLYLVAASAGLAIILILVKWAYARRAGKDLKTPEPAENEGPPLDE